MRRNPPIRHLGAFAAATALLPAIMASSTPAPADLPAVDFGRMGSVGLGGAFAGLDWHTAQSPFDASSNTTTTFSQNGDSLIIRNADGSVTVLGTTNDGGHINSLCMSSGTLYVGGEFSSMASVNSANFIAYSVDEKKFVALGNGLSGPVETVFCDDAHSEVWAGGLFNPPTGAGGNVACWSTQSSSFTAVPFGGLNGRVDVISSSTNGSSLYFGGEFSTRFADSRNTSAFRSLASLPIAPPNTATTGNSGYLTPFTVPAAASQYGGLSVVAGPASDNHEHNNADRLLCPGAGTWYARDKSPAQVQVLSNTFLSVAGVRIANGRLDGRAATEFTLTTLPDNTVRKLKFSNDGKDESCNPHCTLSTADNVWAQDYLFEDGLISITGIQLSLEGWDGAGSALNYIQLLSDGAYASYVQSNNEGVCGKSNSSVNAVGNWVNKTAPSNISGTEMGFMMATVPVDQKHDTALTLYPYVGSAGIYNMFLVIPGCANLGDCDSRTTVDVSVFPQQGGNPWITTVDQRVQVDTTVLLYSGLVDASSPQFNPTINVSLPPNPLPVGTDNYVVVASGVQMTLTGLSDGSQSPWNPPGTPSGTNTIGPSTTNGGTETNAPAGSSQGTPPGSSGPSQTGSAAPGSSTAGSPSGGVAGTSTSTTNPSSANPSSATPSSTSSTIPSLPSSYIRSAFGVYEWARTVANVNAATDALANTTETVISELGFSFEIARNASSAKDFKIVSIAAANDTVYVGGKFALANSYSNVVSTSHTIGADSLASGGLDGVVNAAAAAGNSIYFGGEFTKTVKVSVQVNYLAKWDPTSKSWSGVAGGVDGPVDSLTTVGEKLLVTGRFTSVVSADGVSAPTGGYAIFDTAKGEWSPSGVLFGTGAAAAAGEDDATYLAGRFLGSSRNAVPGVASLVMKDGKAAIETIQGTSFSNKGSASTTSTPSRRALPLGWLGNLRRAFHVARADPAPVPPTTDEAPATLAGTYWTNSSAEGKPKVTIIGGNFTSSNNIAGLAFQHEKTPMTGPTPPVNGVVRALYVLEDTLFVGGANLNVPNVGTGILAYDLRGGKWAGGYSLAGKSGDVVVHAIGRQGDSDVLVAAGNFASTNDGNFACAAVCVWNNGRKQWSQPGQNATISGGEVRAIDFGGPQLDTLVAGGSFVLGGKNVYAAQYHFGSNSWSEMDGLPGPVLSLAINDKNMSNIFAAGVDASNSQPYLQRWDGQSWTAQHSDALSRGTVIQQLAFVPLKTPHDANGVIENNRMLMASGDINLGSGNVSSALYDGNKWHPYLVGSTSKGKIGSISSLFWSDRHFSFDIRKYLARGLVVLVAIAIATGLILILILLILLGAFCLRRRERKQRPLQHYDDKGSEVSSTHQLIHDSVQTALERSLMQPAPGHHHGAGEAAGVAGIGAAGLGAAGYMGRNSTDSQYHDADDEFVATGAGPFEDNSSDEGRETMMRYDFFGPDLQPGELPMRAGQRVIVLDDEQSDEWWYCRDPETGREGVVPSTYVL